MVRNTVCNWIAVSVSAEPDHAQPKANCGAIRVIFDVRHGCGAAAVGGLGDLDYQVGCPDQAAVAAWRAAARVLRAMVFRWQTVERALTESGEQPGDELEH
jgi:hypothetical protein